MDIKPWSSVGVSIACGGISKTSMGGDFFLYGLSITVARDTDVKVRTGGSSGGSNLLDDDDDGVALGAFLRIGESPGGSAGGSRFLVLVPDKCW